MERWFVLCSLGEGEEADQEEEGCKSNPPCRLSKSGAFSFEMLRDLKLLNLDFK